MLRSFFTTAFRNLCKNRVYTSINVLGLALGIACCLVIFVIVKYETSFDDYHGKADRIYRVNLNQQTPHGRRLDGCNYTPLAEAIRKDVSGLEAVTGVYCLREYQFSKNDDLFEETYAFFADHEYFEVFDADWITGNLNMALTMPNTAVVTDSFAETFLGGVNNALGSTFLVENRLTLTVTGIVKAPPSNTDHPYSILIFLQAQKEWPVEFRNACSLTKPNQKRRALIHLTHHADAAAQRFNLRLHEEQPDTPCFLMRMKRFV